MKAVGATTAAFSRYGIAVVVGLFVVAAAACGSTDETGTVRKSEQTEVFRCGRGQTYDVSVVISTAENLRGKCVTQPSLPGGNAKAHAYAESLGLFGQDADSVVSDGHGLCVGMLRTGVASTLSKNKELWTSAGLNLTRFWNKAFASVTYLCPQYADEAQLFMSAHGTSLACSARRDDSSDCVGGPGGVVEPPCSQEVLLATYYEGMVNQFGEVVPPGVAVSEPRCSGGWALVGVNYPGTPQGGSGALFRVASDKWTLVDAGTGWTCADHDVPQEDCAALGWS